MPYQQILSPGSRSNFELNALKTRKKWVLYFVAISFSILSIFSFILFHFLSGHSYCAAVYKQIRSAEESIYPCSYNTATFTCALVIPSDCGKFCSKDEVEKWAAINNKCFAINPAGCVASSVDVTQFYQSQCSSEPFRTLTLLPLILFQSVLFPLKPNWLQDVKNFYGTSRYLLKISPIMLHLVSYAHLPLINSLSQYAVYVTYAEVGLIFACLFVLIRWFRIRGYENQRTIILSMNCLGRYYSLIIMVAYAGLLISGILSVSEYYYAFVILGKQFVKPSLSLFLVIGYLCSFISAILGVIQI